MYSVRKFNFFYYNYNFSTTTSSSSSSNSNVSLFRACAASVKIHRFEFRLPFSSSNLEAKMSDGEGKKIV